jgi:hypothetical protein
MLHLEGDTFAIRNGDTFFTDESGERPDYAAAVMSIGKTLGLPVAKQGVAIFDAPDKSVDSPAIKGLDEKRLNTDAAYKTAYVRVRSKNPQLSHSEITDAMVRKQIEGAQMGSAQDRFLRSAPAASKSNSRR